MIKTTLRKLMMSRQSLNKFGELPFDIATKFDHGDMLDAFGQLLSRIDKLQKEAIERHGGTVDKTTGAIKFEDPDTREVYEAEWEALMDAEREFDHAPIKFSVIEALAHKLEKDGKSVEFTANDFAVLRWMIEK